MKANEAPEKLYYAPYGDIREDNPITDNDIEYVRKDAFIEKACEYLYNYNQKQVLKHGARTTLGCGEYPINVDEFRKYMKRV